MPRETFPGCCCQCPVPVAGQCQCMALQETLRYSQAGLTQVFYGVTVPFPWVLVCNIVLFVPYKHLRFHQSCGSCVIKSHTCWVGDPQTGDPQYQRSSPTAKDLGPTSDFPTREFGKGMGIPRESDFEGKWDLITQLPQDW